MSALDGLIACAGNWRGTNALQDPHNNIAEESSATATVTSVAQGRFVRLDYTWEYQGKPQDGSLLIGFDPKADKVSAHWIDSWHMGRQVMACEGTGPSGSTITVLGSYAAPPGPDWGWRTEITTEDGRSLRVVMYNIWPEGRADLAAEAVYTRA